MNGKYICLTIAIASVNLVIAINNTLTTNARLPTPDKIHNDINDNNQKRISFILQKNKTKSSPLFIFKKPQQRSASHRRWPALKNNASSHLTGNTLDSQINPPSIINHLTTAWVFVQNHKKVAYIEVFNFSCTDYPEMHIKSYALELNKRQGTMAKINIPCEDALKVGTYITNMYTAGSSRTLI